MEITNSYEFITASKILYLTGDRGGPVNKKLRLAAMMSGKACLSDSFPLKLKEAMPPTSWQRRQSLRRVC